MDQQATPERGSTQPSDTLLNTKAALQPLTLREIAQSSHRQESSTQHICNTNDGTGDSREYHEVFMENESEQDREKPPDRVLYKLRPVDNQQSDISVHSQDGLDGGGSIVVDPEDDCMSSVSGPTSTIGEFMDNAQGWSRHRMDGLRNPNPPSIGGTHDDDDAHHIDPRRLDSDSRRLVEFALKQADGSLSYAEKILIRAHTELLMFEPSGDFDYSHEYGDAYNRSGPSTQASNADHSSPRDINQASRSKRKRSRLGSQSPMLDDRAPKPGSSPTSAAFMNGFYDGFNAAVDHQHDNGKTPDRPSIIHPGGHNSSRGHIDDCQPGPGRPRAHSHEHRSLSFEPYRSASRSFVGPSPEPPPASATRLLAPAPSISHYRHQILEQTPGVGLLPSDPQMDEGDRGYSSDDGESELSGDERVRDTPAVDGSDQRLRRQTSRRARKNDYFAPDEVERNREIWKKIKLKIANTGSETGTNTDRVYCPKPGCRLSEAFTFSRPERQRGVLRGGFAKHWSTHFPPEWVCCACGNSKSRDDSLIRHLILDTPPNCLDRVNNGVSWSNMSCFMQALLVARGEEVAPYVTMHPKYQQFKSICLRIFCDEPFDTMFIEKSPTGEAKVVNRL